MKTLSKEMTAAFYQDADGYARLKAHWSRLMQDKEARKRLAAPHHLLYLVLRGKNWQKAFAPITNPTKRNNGGFYAWGARWAVRTLHADINAEWLLAPFQEVIGKEALCAVRERVPALGGEENPLEKEPYNG